VVSVVKGTTMAFVPYESLFLLVVSWGLSVRDQVQSNREDREESGEKVCGHRDWKRINNE